MNKKHEQTYLCFAGLLDYPRAGLAERVREFAEFLEEHCPEAAREIRAFLDFVSDTPPGRMEEIYTATFDVNPTCTPYVGYQLFGESYQRGEFLVRLKEKYREHEFAEGNELPDHLTVLFRFISELDDDLLVRELIEDGLLPALEKMLSGFKGSPASNPYTRVLRAAQHVLAGTLSAVPVTGRAS